VKVFLIVLWLCLITRAYQYLCLLVSILYSTRWLPLAFVIPDLSFRFIIFSLEGMSFIYEFGVAAFDKSLITLIYSRSSYSFRWNINYNKQEKVHRQERRRERRSWLLDKRFMQERKEYRSSVTFLLSDLRYACHTHIYTIISMHRCICNRRAARTFQLTWTRNRHIIAGI